MWITRAFFLKIVFERHFFDAKNQKLQFEICFFLISTSKIFCLVLFHSKKYLGIRLFKINFQIDAKPNIKKG
jgi:hypothetical protein